MVSVFTRSTACEIMRLLVIASVSSRLLGPGAQATLLIFCIVDGNLLPKRLCMPPEENSTMSLESL